MKIQKKYRLSPKLSHYVSFVLKEKGVSFEESAENEISISLSNFSRIYFSGPIQLISKYGAWKALKIVYSNESIAFLYDFSLMIFFTIHLFFSAFFFIGGFFTIYESQGLAEYALGMVLINILILILNSVIHVLFFFRIKFFEIKFLKEIKQHLKSP